MSSLQPQYIFLLSSFPLSCHNHSPSVFILPCRWGGRNCNCSFNRCVCHLRGSSVAAMVSNKGVTHGLECCLPVSSLGPPETLGLLTLRRTMYRVHTQGTVHVRGWLAEKIECKGFCWLSHLKVWCWVLTFRLVIFILTLTNRKVVVFIPAPCTLCVRQFVRALWHWTVRLMQRCQDRKNRTLPHC